MEGPTYTPGEGITQEHEQWNVEILMATPKVCPLQLTYLLSNLQFQNSLCIALDYAYPFTGIAQYSNSSLFKVLTVVLLPCLSGCKCFINTSDGGFAARQS